MDEPLNPSHIMACPLLTGSPVFAQSRIFDLHLVNGANNDPVKFKIGAAYCYECIPGAGEPVGLGRPVYAGENRTIKVARVQGNDCDGQDGVFVLIVEDAGTKNSSASARIKFVFDNAGSLWIHDKNGSEIVGTLSQKSPVDESYTWSRHDKKRVTAKKATGSWGRRTICSYPFCQEKRGVSITSGETSISENSSEIMKAFSITLDGGVDLGVFSASASATASQEKSIGQRLSREISSSRAESWESDFVVSKEQMDAAGIQSVWRFEAVTEMSNGKKYTMKSNHFACTPGIEPPTWLPGSPEHIASCRSK